MDFTRPNAFYLSGLILVLVAVLAWDRSRRRAAVARFGTPSLVSLLSDSVSQRRRRQKLGLWFTALVVLVLALARPRWGSQVTVNVQEGVEVMVALDVSTSMLAEDIKPNRLTRAKLTIEELMDRLGGNDIGLVAFAGAAFVQFPLTADLNTARSFLDGAQPTSVSRSGTALGEAIRVSLSGFPQERATSRVILLLTDGEGHEDDPLAAARYAAEEGVVIHAIGFGSPTGEPIPLRDSSGAVSGYKKDAQGETVLSRLDEVTLQQVASETGGLYKRASAGGEEIDAIVGAIASLDTAEGEGQFEVRGVERYEWFAAAACLLLAGESLLGDRRRRARV